MTWKWYLLPVKSQKELVLMLHMAKKPKSINIGGVLPLNADTFLVVSHQHENQYIYYFWNRLFANHIYFVVLQLLKRIYSFAMVLNNSV